ncbi:MAG TPA: Crp/Fnr family transcriptional regulator [Ohtaekwangia sp.]|nr:Crp/Fnr family transcriptional regulator [Ohtaekwangia sp.]
MDKNTTLLYKKISALKSVSPSDIDKFFNASACNEFTKGQIILKRGEVCKNVFFVEKGYVRSFIDKDGSELNLSFTLEGNFTTNLKSLRTSVPSDLTIRVEEPSVIYAFNKDELLSLYTVSPAIESFGRKIVEELLIAQEEHTNLFKIYSPGERYAYLLTTKPEMLQRISLSQLASYLGIARETLSRIRKKVLNELL